MTNRRKRAFDVLSVGELLIDMISTDFADNLEAVKQFTKIQGGSPANLCMNMARLGNHAKLVATVGNDDMGKFLKNNVLEVGVDGEHIFQADMPSTLILVTRSQWTSNFEAYRAADCQILPLQLPKSLLWDTSIFHTTCFALSKAPAQSTILQAAEKAAWCGCQLSIDLNYAQKIWQDRAAAQLIVAQYCQYGAIVKVSEVDWERLYELPFERPEQAGEYFLQLGATAVCVTMGGQGLMVMSSAETHFLPSRKVEVKDTTGAGDAFWSGFLTAWLDGHVLLNAAKAGRKMAEHKIGHFGTLPNRVDRAIIYEDVQE
ncbi:MAG: carbohydrate kinase [Saprospiraceae bacterium]|nr:carbohydrate kinase [Saprospiraceae bacterium]